MRTLQILVCALLSVVASAAAVNGQELAIADNGRSDFKIVVADDASPSTKYGAAELQTFLKEMTGAELPIVSDKSPVSPHEIVLGDGAHLKKLGIEVDFEKLGKEGYVIRTVGPHLVIAGGALRGNMYGVYGLLEDHLGCRWFTPEVSKIPKRKRLLIDELNETQIPVLEYREPFVKECFDGDWCARNRVNSSAAALTEKHGGKVTYYGFVHTFNSLVPPSKYFDEHPEYFSEIGGKRIKGRTQLCCTNEDVIRIVTEQVRERMRTHPEAFVFSVSQNDWGNFCQCAKCKALADEEGTWAAPLMHLVNSVAEALADEFPDKAIDTLAYQWSRKPPKTMRPRPNVIVRLCSIECCFSHPLGTCDSPQNRAFVRDIEGWSKVSHRLWVWDYCTSFPHYLLPFPNQRVRDDNIRFFVKNHVTGVFEEGTYNTLGSELAALGGYMMAKFLWNPSYGEDRAMNEFLEGVYEEAAPFIRRYIDMLHDRVEKENIHVNIWVGPNGPHLTDALLAKANELYDEAEDAVAGKPDVLKRVQIARSSIDYALFQRARMGISRKRTINHQEFKIVPDPVLVRRFEPFFAALKASGMTRLSEGRATDLDAYRKSLEPLVKEQEFRPLAPVAIEGLVNGLDYQYYEGSWKSTPDFDSLEPAKTGTALDFSLASRSRDDNFAFKFTGYISAPRNGIYTFNVRSDDGSKLSIGSTEVVNNDGVHPMAGKSGHVALKAGKHPITLIFFEASGEEGLEVSYEGPDIPKQEIPASALYHKGAPR